MHPKTPTYLKPYVDHMTGGGAIFLLFQDCCFFFETEFGFACSMLGKSSKHILPTWWFDNDLPW